MSTTFKASTFPPLNHIVAPLNGIRFLIARNPFLVCHKLYFLNRTTRGGKSVLTISLTEPRSCTLKARCVLVSELNYVLCVGSRVSKTVDYYRKLNWRALDGTATQVQLIRSQLIATWGFQLTIGLFLPSPIYTVKNNNHEIALNLRSGVD